MGVAHIDMRRVVRLFALPAGTVKISRVTGPGQWVNGRFEEAARIEVSLAYASIQPFTPEQRQTLPEGVRTSDTAHLYCIDAVYPVKRANQTESDYVLYNGSTWDVLELTDFNADANYWQATIVRLGQ